MDEIKNVKAEIFDIQVQIEQLMQVKNQKLQQLQNLLNEPRGVNEQRS